MTGGDGGTKRKADHIQPFRVGYDWTKVEEDALLNSINKCGNDWKRIKKNMYVGGEDSQVKSRTIDALKSHYRELCRAKTAKDGGDDIGGVGVVVEEEEVEKAEKVVVGVKRKAEEEETEPRERYSKPRDKLKNI